MPRYLHLSLVRPRGTPKKMVGNLQFGAMAILYLFSQASQHGKNIDFSKFDKLELVSQDYGIGFLNGFEATGLIEFTIHKKAIIPTRCSELIVKELKNFLESIIKVTKETNANSLKTKLERIDNFVA